MHHCLEVIDILEIIFNQVHDCFGLQDILHLVLTSHHFKTHALPLLWRTLETPAPLFMAMPASLWKIKEIKDRVPPLLHFVRRATPKDWWHFNTYAKYVKELGSLNPTQGSGWRRIQIARGVYEQFRKSRRKRKVPLLPKLASITCDGSWTDIDLDLLPAFMAEILRKLHLSSKIVEMGEYGDSLKLWNEMRVKSPHIESFTCTGSRSSIIQHQMGHFVTGLGNLKVVHCPSFLLSDHAIRHLLSLPTLRSLAFQIVGIPELIDICDPVACPLDTPKLTSLEELELVLGSSRTRSTESFSAALNLLSIPGLRLFTIISFHNHISGPELQSIFASLTGRYKNSKLESLRIISDDSVHAEAEDADDLSGLSPVTIQAFIFESMDLPSLGYLILPDHFLDADDAEVKRIVFRLPMLRVFKLACDPGSNSSLGRPRMTLACLLSFAKYCPLLKELSLYLDGGMVSWPSDETLRELAHPNLSELSLGYSPLAERNSEKADNFLDTLFPNLETVSWYSRDALDYLESDEWEDEYDWSDELDADGEGWDGMIGLENDSQSPVGSPLF